MVAREILLQGGDGVERRDPSVQPAAVVSALGASPAPVAAPAGAPGGGRRRRGALVAAPGRGRLAQAVGQVRQLAESGVPVREGRRVRAGGGPALLLMLAVMVLEVGVMRVVLRQGPDLRGEAASEAGADVVGEILEQQSTVVGRGGGDPSLVEEAGVFVDDGGGGRRDGRGPVAEARQGRSGRCQRLRGRAQPGGLLVVKAGQHGRLDLDLLLAVAVL